MVVDEPAKSLIGKGSRTLTYTESYSEAAQFQSRACGGTNTVWKCESMLGFLSPMRWRWGRNSLAASPVQKTC